MDTTTKRADGNQVLLIADQDVQSIVKLLNETGVSKDNNLVVVSSLPQALGYLDQQSISVILLSQQVNGAEYTDVLSRCHKTHPFIPIIVMLDTDDEMVERKLLEVGAQDCIDQNKITQRGLARALRNAKIRSQAALEISYQRDVLSNLADCIEKNDMESIEQTLEKGGYADKLDSVIIADNKALLSKIKQQNIKLQQLAHFDFLTQLPNRLQFEHQLDRTFSSAIRHNNNFALLILDLDRFKIVNDTLGHMVGDALLQSVSKRFLSRMRTEDFIARIGGDEFAVILNDIQNVHAAGIVANKIIRSLVMPVSIEGEEISVGISIGIACYPIAAKDAEGLVKAADVAMYNAKKDPQSAYRYSNEEVHKKHFYRISLEEGLQEAISKNQLSLHYQPIYNIETEKLDSMEALLRWEHPEFGMISPEEFIPLAEESASIIPIGAWVIRQACRQYAQWCKQGYNFRLAINLSPRQLLDESLPRIISEALAQHDLPNEILELEITEMALMVDGNCAVSVLEQLKGKGIHCSMDDFGTDYSSLSRLKRLPISTLKIDRSFVNGIGTTGEDDVLIETIIMLSRKLNLDVVAEGVETEEQLNFLLKQGCKRVQGYYFSKPLASESIELYLAGIPF